MLLRRTIAAVGLAILVMLAAAACSSEDSPGPGASPEHAIRLGVAHVGHDDYRGGEVIPPFDKPDIVLTDSTGKPYDLRKETDGKLTLLYLGYTHCPDICPLHMLDIAQTLKKLPPEQAAKVKVVFITTDPERDTPEVLGKWLAYFNKDYIGLTGSTAAIARLHEQLSMPLPEKTDLGDGEYSVSHAAYVLAFTPDNQGHLVFPSGFSREDWLHDLGKLTTEGWSN